MESRGMVTSWGEGVEEQQMLFTYSEEEQQENRMAKNNASLVLNPEFIPMYPKMLQNGYSLIEATIYGFIRFFLSNNERFYCTNEQLCSMLNLGETSISQAINKLQKDGLIECKYKTKSGGGKIRFIQLLKYETLSFEIQNSKFGNTKDIYNNIIDNKSNNISISNDIDNIYSPQKKVSGPIKQKTAEESLTLPQNPLPSPVIEFLKESYNSFPSMRYQLDKNPEKYKEGVISDFEKLSREYGEETVFTVLRFIKQDEFWSKQIQSIGKLRKKNKDGVPYMVVMMDKIKDYKPNVLDLDAIKGKNL